MRPCILSYMENYCVGLNSVFQALADPTRRAVIERLDKGPATVSELAAPFDLTLPSFLKHISVLESSQLIASRKHGRVRTCSLARGNFNAAEEWLDELRTVWARRYDNLDNLLNTMNGDLNGI